MNTLITPELIEKVANDIQTKFADVNLSDQFTTAIARAALEAALPEIERTYSKATADMFVKHYDFFAWLFNGETPRDDLQKSYENAVASGVFNSFKSH